MPHAMNPTKMNAYMTLLGKYKSFIKRHILGSVFKYLLPEFELVANVLFHHRVKQSMFVDTFSCMTMGCCYVPALHADGDDCTFTVLVAAGEVSAGGEFAFPSLGHVLPVQPGMIWIVNGAVPHCTCEMSLSEQLDPNADDKSIPLRSTLALFSKVRTVQAAARTNAYVMGNGAEHCVSNGKRAKK